MPDNFERVRENFARQPFMNTLGASLRRVQSGAIEIEVPFRADLTQQNGYMHAGVITSVLDSACGYAALSVAPEQSDVLSVEFKVNLLSPAVGDLFVARSRVKRAGKRLTVAAADAFAIQHGREKLVATMLATIVNVEPKSNSNRNSGED
jgi:uncharacterized protein (TIGR00369 family)